MKCVRVRDKIQGLHILKSAPLGYNSKTIRNFRRMQALIIIDLLKQMKGRKYKEVRYGTQI